jgi:hypothetical protein
MPIQLNDLCPYRSLLLCTCPGKWNLNAAVQELRDYADTFDNVEHVETASGIANRHGLRVKFFYYRVKQKPSWLLNQQVEDIIHELVVVFRRKTSIAILTTESRLRNKIRNHFDIANQSSVGELSPIPITSLNSAYIQGKINTLWLSGTHRHVPSQADNKAISGSDLLYALDPLGDQTFFFTSAVSKLANNAFKYKVGVSPHKSYIWAGPSDDGDHLCEGVSQLFDILQNSPAQNANPLPMLAAPALDSITVNQVANAYEAALLPNELLDYDLPAAERALADRWSRLAFDITAHNNANFDASIALENADGTSTPLGSIRIAFDLAKPGRISWTATSIVAPQANQQLQDDAIAIINGRREWFKVWFESGHTLLDQKFFTGRMRDAQFSFCFADFTQFAVKKEKPASLAVVNIGAGDSLFCWVRRRWHRALPLAGNVSGWLACNDGAMEIADFIHFDQIGPESELTLIHVKGSKSANANRQLSVSDYEVVVGQAIKNLRFLDLQNTLANFTVALNQRLLNASWRAGVANTRANMIAAMNGAATPPRRRVVVVQPRVRQTALNAARAAAPNTRQSMISRQLDTLLLSARASCQNLGAEFVVIADQA